MAEALFSLRPLENLPSAAQSASPATSYEEAARELSKLAGVQTELLPHQSRIVERISKPDQPGLVVAHGLGRGKTLSSIAAQESLGVPADVVVPAALRANYQKEVAKHVGAGGEQHARNITSLQRVARGGQELKNPLLIVDEAHRVRNPSSSSLKGLAGSSAQKRLLLTGSPFYNKPNDLSPLVNIAAGEEVLPENKQDFYKKYVRERPVSPGLLGKIKGVKPGVIEELNPKERDNLRGLYQKWVDYEPGSSENFPSVEHQTIRVPMAKDQLKVYDAMMGKAPSWVSYKVKKGLPPSKSESKNLNAFMSAARQISNTTQGFQTKGTAASPKIDAAVKAFQEQLKTNPEARAVIYSNYLESGLKPYAAKLQELGVPHGLFTGEEKSKDRNELVRRYNEGKVRALLLSAAGGEGLDLKGTRLIQLLDPHWNVERSRQVEGRGIRYKSHEELPEADRKVLVQKFLSTRPRAGLLENLHLSKPGGSSDEYLESLADQKERLNSQFRELLRRPPEKAGKKKPASGR